MIFIINEKLRFFTFVDRFLDSFMAKDTEEKRERASVKQLLQQVCLKFIKNQGRLKVWMLHENANSVEYRDA